MSFKILKYAPTKKQKDFPSLIFVHGAWHGAWCWQPNFLPFFAEQGFECYAFDLPHHGEEKDLPNINRLRIADYVERLKVVMTRIDAPCILIGHSMGAYVVQQYLEEADDCLAAILLASVPGKPIYRLFLKAFKDMPWSMLKLLANLDVSQVVNTPAKATNFLFSPTMPSEKLQTYFQKLGTESFKVIVIDFLWRNLRPRKNKTIPVLVQCAENDQMVSIQENKVTARMQEADFQFVKNIAHDVMLEENWLDAAQGILKWINQKFPATMQDREEKKLQTTSKNSFSSAISDLITTLDAKIKQT